MISAVANVRPELVVALRDGAREVERELLALRRMDVELVDATIRVHRNMGKLTGGRLVVGSLKSSAGGGGCLIVACDPYGVN